VLLTIPALKKNYIHTGKVRYIFKDFPLSFHPNAQKAAEAAHCAGAQGAYWAMHDKLFQMQGKFAITPADLTELAKQIGADQIKFSSCLSSSPAFIHYRSPLDAVPYRSA